MASVLESVRPTVDATIKNLFETKFIIDPIARRELSRVTSIISSAYKRHGGIIEMALYLELFARERRGKWDAIGDQLNDPVSRYLRRQPSRIRGVDDIAAPVVTAYAAE